MYPPPKTDDVKELRQWCEEFYDYVQRTIPRGETPAFLAGTVSATSIAALTTHYTVDFDTEIFDDGNNFASDTFTAPQKGRYFLSTNIRILDADSAATYYYIRLVTSNRNYYCTRVGDDIGSDGSMQLNISVVADMDAGDTAYVEVYQAGGTIQSSVQGASTSTNFSGFLVRQ